MSDHVTTISRDKRHRYETLDGQILWGRVLKITEAGDHYVLVNGKTTIIFRHAIATITLETET